MRSKLLKTTQKTTEFVDNAILNDFRSKRWRSIWVLVGRDVKALGASVDSSSLTYAECANFIESGNYKEFKHESIILLKH